MYHFLVVDDEAKIREIFKKYAVFEGYRVTEAANGMEAIDLCRTEPFDLIIMDVMMPELDGFSACREIRKYNRTPIIMLSARSEEYDRILTDADSSSRKPGGITVDDLARIAEAIKAVSETDDDVPAIAFALSRRTTSHFEQA